MGKEEFKPKRKLKERYSLEGIAKSRGITVDELTEQHHIFKEERGKILEKYRKKGMTTEQANRMTMLEMYIPGFAGPTFRD
tara:strand:+ start:343 stop:585 length:243 start_codon:yes stop_codon:yes gene_type:complete